MADEGSGKDDARAQAGPDCKTIAAVPKDPRNAIIDALLELASERSWEDIMISDVASRANVSLSAFRDYFPSKGAVLASLSRRIDHIVLDATGDDLAGEPAKDRLFDVLMRRLDALAPYKLGLEAIYEWARRDPLAALLAAWQFPRRQLVKGGALIFVDELRNLLHAAQKVLRNFSFHGGLFSNAGCGYFLPDSLFRPPFFI